MSLLCYTECHYADILTVFILRVIVLNATRVNVYVLRARLLSLCLLGLSHYAECLHADCKKRFMLADLHADKHSSLLRKSVNYDRKFFIGLTSEVKKK